MEQSSSWEANGVVVSHEIHRHFTEPEGSLPHSQLPAACLYPVNTTTTNNNNNKLLLFIYLFSLAMQPSAGYGLLVHEVSWSQTTTHHSM
jgi:hypothetical protein